MLHSLLVCLFIVDETFTSLYACCKFPFIRFTVNMINNAFVVNPASIRDSKQSIKNVTTIPDTEMVATRYVK